MAVLWSSTRARRSGSASICRRSLSKLFVWVRCSLCVIVSVLHQLWPEGALRRVYRRLGWLLRTKHSTARSCRHHTEELQFGEDRRQTALEYVLHEDEA